jgi:hypothetical protein
MDQTTSQRDRNIVKGKLLRRRTILRERDYFQLHRDALACGYHRTAWEPVTYENVHKEMTWQVLRDTDFKDTVFFSAREERYQNSMSDWQKSLMKVIDDEEKFMRQYIHWLRENKRLYNDNWRKWSWRVHRGGIEIRWAQNRDYEPLGVATLERDY